MDPADIKIAKESCDTFLDAALTETLNSLSIDELIMTGCTTDFCADTIVQTALARGYRMIVPVDGHTTGDRPYLATQKAIEHHNAILADFISPVAPAILPRCDALGAGIG